MLLSVIIPTRNRARLLADLLDSLGKQDPVSFDWEVIVVDNASTDDTAEVTKTKSASLPIKLRYIREPSLGLHHGRHRGAGEANGSVLGYLDDDMILFPSWVKGIEPIVSGEADAIVGRIFPKWEVSPPDWMDGLWSHDEQGALFSYLGLMDLGEVKKPVPPIYILGGNCFIRKETLFDLGGFHPDGMPSEFIRFRGDGETGLMKKFEERGLTGVYDPLASVYHVITPERVTVEYLMRRAYNQGISDSYTDIRANGGVCDAPPAPCPNRSLLRRISERSPRELMAAVVRRVRRAVSRGGTQGDSAVVQGIRNKLSEAYAQGRRFHEEAVKEDSELLAHVLKATYFT